MIEVIERGKAWYKVLAYWELRRVPYNLIMIFGGLVSMAILYANIPALYILIGVALNIGYSALWLIDLAIIKLKNHDRGKKLFWWYVFISLCLVLVPPILLLASMLMGK